MKRTKVPTRMILRIFWTGQWNEQPLKAPLNTQLEVGTHRARQCWSLHITEDASTTFKSRRTDTNQRRHGMFIPRLKFYSITAYYRKRPRKLLVRDQSTRPILLHKKNGREAQDGWLIPTTSCRAGNNKQHKTLIWEPSIATKTRQWP